MESGGHKSPALLLKEHVWLTAKLLPFCILPHTMLRPYLLWSDCKHDSTSEILILASSCLRLDSLNRKLWLEGSPSTGQSFLRLENFPNPLSVFSCLKCVTPEAYYIGYPTHLLWFPLPYSTQEFPTTNFCTSNFSGKTQLIDKGSCLSHSSTSSTLGVSGIDRDFILNRVSVTQWVICWMNGHIQ